MARPRKHAHEKFNKRLPSPRCTEAEFSAVHAKAQRANMTVTEYIRQMALHGKVTMKKSQGITANFELVQQLKKIGTNVNQIAKNLNIFGSPATADQKRVWLKLEQVLDNLLTTL